jgi:hypothetical protein
MSIDKTHITGECGHCGCMFQAPYERPSIKFATGAMVAEMIGPAAGAAASGGGGPGGGGPGGDGDAIDEADEEWPELIYDDAYHCPSCDDNWGYKPYDRQDRDQAKGSWWQHITTKQACLRLHIEPYRSVILEYNSAELRNTGKKRRKS